MFVVGSSVAFLSLEIFVVSGVFWRKAEWICDHHQSVLVVFFSVHM